MRAVAENSVGAGRLGRCLRVQEALVGLGFFRFSRRRVVFGVFAGFRGL